MKSPAIPKEMSNKSNEKLSIAYQSLRRADENQKKTKEKQRKAGDNARKPVKSRGMLKDKTKENQ